MVLDFGLLGDKTGVQSSDYKSAGSHQAENVNYVAHSGNSAYNVIHTVTTGKTFYVSLIIIASEAGGTAKIATGASGSEVDFLVAILQANVTLVIELPTPIKMSSGTRITVNSTTGQNSHFTLIGWEE